MEIWNAIHGIGQETEKIRPTYVLVQWSESPDFKNDKIYPFDEFEELALKVANGQGVGKGYFKTKITVHFDGTVDTYTCRVDLAADDEVGFRNHAEHLIAYYDKNIGKLGNRIDDYTPLVNFLKKIDFDLNRTVNV